MCYCAQAAITVPLPGAETAKINFLTALEAGSPRSGAGRVGFWRDLPSWLQLLPMSSHGLSSVSTGS